MGGSYNKGVHGSNGGNKGRPYGLMLLLAFGAALLGVMVLHKLRERRIYNLLVKEKDKELISLQFLLQKERDFNKEIKRKNEEMKDNIYSIRTKKMELDRKVLEMQSTMDSMKDEQRVMETAFEEKQNEIRMLREKELNLGKENTNAEVLSLSESLKKKEAELEDLKHRLQVSLRSVSTDEPSNLPVNLTVNGSTEGKDKTESSESKEKDEQPQDQSAINGNGENIANQDATKDKSIKFSEGETATTVEDENEGREGNTDRRDVIEEQMQTKENLQVERQSTDSEVIASGKVISEGEGKKNEDSDEKAVVDGKEKESIKDGKQGKLENSIDGGREESHLNHMGGVKLEMPDNSRVATDLSAKGKHSHATRGKGKRWRKIVRNRLLGNEGISTSHGAVNTTSRKLYRDEKDGLKNGIQVATSNDEKVGEGMRDTSLSEDNVESKLMNPKDGRDVNDQVANDRLDEDNGSQKSWNRRHIKKVEGNAEQAKVGNLKEEPEGFKVADTQEKAAFTDDYFFRKSDSDFEDETE